MKFIHGEKLAIIETVHGVVICPVTVITEMARTVANRPVKRSIVDENYDSTFWYCRKFIGCLGDGVGVIGVELPFEFELPFE